MKVGTVLSDDDIDKIMSRMSFPFLPGKTRLETEDFVTGFARAVEMNVLLSDGVQKAVRDGHRLRKALESISDCCNEDHAARDYASRQTEILGIARYALENKGSK